MLRLQVTGNLGKDATVRALDSGWSAISFSVASSKKYKDKQGQMVEETTWIRCTKWVKDSDPKLVQFLKKGTTVYVEGEPKINMYWDGEDPKTSLELTCDMNNNGLILMGQPKTGTEATQPKSNEKPKYTVEQPHTPDDDLPF